MKKTIVKPLTNAEKRKARRLARKNIDRALTEVVKSIKEPSPPETPPKRDTDKQPRRVKTVITTDNLLKLKENGEEVKVEFCDFHHDLLSTKLEKQGISDLITYNSTDLVERLKSRKIEPMFQSCEALIKLAINVIGTEGVILHRCPICAFQKFDFLGQVANQMRLVAKQQEAR